MFYQTLPPPLLSVVLKRWMHVFVVAAFLFCFFLSCLCVCVCVQQQQLCFSVQHRKEEKKGNKTILPIK